MKNVIDKFSVIVIFLAALNLASCSEKNIDGTRTQGITKADGGALAGGVGGAVIGHQFGSGTGNSLATLGGAVAGAFAGHAIGSSMDEPDKAQYSRANARPANVSPYNNILEYTRTGEPSDWTNINGQMVQVTPTRTYKNNNGDDCRDYIQAYGNGTQSRGFSCRQADGTWN